MDGESWTTLRDKALYYVERRHELRAWEQLFDCLHEASGYYWLKGLGCNQIEFLPTTPGTPQPDLRARFQDSVCLLEVKCINRSDESLRNLTILGRDPVVFRDASYDLPPEFYKKLNSTLDVARTQLNARPESATARKIALLVLGFDPPRPFAHHHVCEVTSFLSQNGPTDFAVALEHSWVQSTLIRVQGL